MSNSDSSNTLKVPPTGYEKNGKTYKLNFDPTEMLKKIEMKLRAIIFLTFLYLFKIFPSYALIEVDITRENLDPLPIAISPLHVDLKSENINDLKIKKLGENINNDKLEKNFKSTGLFNPLKKETFVQKPDIAHLKPRFEDWRLIEAQGLVTGKLLIEDSKLKLSLDFGI